MSEPKSTVGHAWAVLSIRNHLEVKDVKASANCCLFSTKDEAIAFAHRVVGLKKNWAIHVALVPIISDHKDAVLPEGWAPFSEN